MKQRMRRFVAVLTTVLTLVTAFSSPLLKVSGDGGKEVTGKAVVESVKISAKQKDGSWKEVESGDTLYRDQAGKIELTWGIADMNGVIANDYFYFDLANSWFKFDKTKEPLKLVSNDGKKEELGTYEITSDMKLKVVLNSKAVEKAALEQGFFNLEFTIIGLGTDEIINFMGKEITDIDFEDTPREDIDEAIRDNDVLKVGNQIKNENAIQWEIYVNQINAKLAFEKTLGTNVGEPQQWKHTVLTDDLTESLEFIDDNSFAIWTPVHVATADGKQANINDWYYLTHMFEKVEQDLGESYDTFYGRVTEDNTPRYGIYNNKQLIVNFGDLQTDDGSGLKISQDIIDEIINKNPGLSQQQIADTKTANADTNHTNGDRLEFIVQFQTTVSGNNKDQKNQGKVTFENGNKDSNEFNVKFDKITGGVQGIDPGKVVIKKTDDINTKLEGIIFKLMIQNDSGRYVDYVPKDGGPVTRTTNIDGIVEFDKLDFGTYKVVETSHSDTYGDPIFVTGDTFVVSNSDTEGKEIRVINPALTTIEGLKIWDDSNNIDMIRPDSIKVELYADGQKVDGYLPVWDTVSEDNEWSYRFEKLPKYKDGVEIPYSVKEVDVATGYTVSYDVNNVIINKHVPKKPEKPTTPELPSTGAYVNNSGYLLVCVGIATIIISNKRRSLRK